MTTAPELVCIFKSCIQEAGVKRAKRAISEFDVRESDHLHIASHESRCLLEFQLSCIPGIPGLSWEMPIRGGIGSRFAAGKQFVKTSHPPVE